MTAVPTSFGKYFLTEKIATGGMAEIYLAKLIGPGGFEKQLIIKQILPQFSGHRQFVELFVDEAKTLVALSHGNIVPVYELGVVDDTYFIAMEYIDGPTLERLLRALAGHGETMAAPMAVYIAGELLKGLDYAHRKADGVIHRDLSPRNVMLSREGEVKIVDFGLAVTVEGKQLSSGAGGRPVGSYPYMSPEQVRREKLDGRTDIFSAGVLLWEMLTGKHLFARSGEDETLAAVLEAPIAPPSEVNTGAPPSLDAICRRALARDRGDRYHDAGEFLTDLHRVLYKDLEPVNPHDLSKLLARICPPGTAERTAAARPPGDSDSDSDSVEPAEEPGSHTRPMGAPPAGKRRAGTVQTFATSLVFEEVLANATPHLGVRAVSDVEAAIAARKAEARAKREARAQGAEDAGAAATAPTGRVRTLWLPLGAAALLVAGALFVSARPRAGSTPVDDAAPVALPAPADAEPQAADPSDAGPVVAVADLADASPPPDAWRRRPHGGKDPGEAQPRGEGELSVGASPWGHVYLNGRKLGSAPGSWKVPAGRHRVEVRFGEQHRTFQVTIEPDKSTHLGLVEFDP